ncbi:MAG: TolC family protein [Porphyromonadaceae bacterium]|nr:TolC family protein [Porphyromonadaceae bacterium]
MKSFKQLFLTILLFSLSLSVYSQAITLDECQDLARANFPIAKQQGMIDQITKATIEALMAQYFPQFRLSGQASYQSDVTKIDLQMPEGLPTIDVPTIDKDQYKVYLDISQTVFGGGSLGVQQQITRAEAATNKQQIEVELYKLRDKVNQVYFGILLADEQLKQTELLKNDLNSALEKVKVLVKNGVVLETEKLNLEAELITLNQNIRDIEFGRKALFEVLNKLTGTELDNDTKLEKPIFASPNLNFVRPELTLIDYKKNTLSLQNLQLAALNVPEISLFLQGGWGKPALNLFNNKFEPYYVGGVRFQWNISRLYTIIRDRRNIDIRLKMYDVEKEVFQLNNEIEHTRQRNKIEQLISSIETDNKLITLRSKIKETSQIQLENGVITSNEFIREANAENQARQTKILHEIQLLQAKFDLDHITPNP